MVLFRRGDHLPYVREDDVAVVVDSHCRDGQPLLESVLEDFPLIRTFLLTLHHRGQDLLPVNRRHLLKVFLGR
jgi:hypothetical protein